MDGRTFFDYDRRDFLTYLQWIKLYPEVMEEYESRPFCEKCEGEGTVTCGECGQDRECENCDGFGHVGESPAIQYNNQLLREIKLLEEYKSLFKVA